MNELKVIEQSIYVLDIRSSTRNLSPGETAFLARLVHERAVYLGEVCYAGGHVHCQKIMKKRGN